MQPVLKIIRGLPGAGKSTLAKAIFHATPQCIHLEADQYFMVNGEYRFRADMLPFAHAWCRRTAREYLNEGFTVVVSNTFTTQKEVAPYLEIAKETGAAVQIITVEGPWESVHNVPEETVAKMKQRFVPSLTTA